LAIVREADEGRERGDVRGAGHQIGRAADPHGRMIGQWLRDERAHTRRLL
jgi:hypothetical protein